VILVDTRLKEIFDFTADETPLEEFVKRVHPDDLERVLADREAALNPADPKPYAHEYRIRRRDGEVRWVEVHGLAYFEGAGPEQRLASFIGTAQDITERREPQERRQGCNDFAAKFPRRFEKPGDAFISDPLLEGFQLLRTGTRFEILSGNGMIFMDEENQPRYASLECTVIFHLSNRDVVAVRHVAVSMGKDADVDLSFRPVGPPLPAAPPCIRHRFRCRTLGDLQG
jgi:PAS domain S-box-containing protein